MQPAQGPPTSPTPLGARLGKYEILTRLAVGGMAEIFLAVVTGIGGFRKLVTLKRILPDLRREEQFVKMFLDEARISAALSHSNIAQVFDLGVEGDELYIAMEFVAGCDVGELLRECKRRKRPVPLGLAVMIVKEICQALHYAHHFSVSGVRAAVIHRDISPNNVMVTYDGAVKVIDFGVAKAKGSINKTGEGAVKGSNGYMSPEQARGKDIDGRSDLFSVAVVLYELLTGEALFLRRTDLLTLRAILRDEIPDPRKLNPGVPAALANAVMRALHRDPQVRFQTGREMARALDDALPNLMFDEAQASAFMCELFADRMQQTRALFELSSPKSDEASLAAAAKLLRETTTPRQVEQWTETKEVKPIQSGVMQLNQVVEDKSRRSRILVVDDSEISRRFVEAHVMEAGYETVCCTSAEEALETMTRKTVDLCLLDLLMPGIDGFKLCQLIREKPEWRTLPIIFVSSACSLEERMRGLTVGGDDFIRKPYDPAELVARIHAHLQRVAFLRQVQSKGA
ncbi:MAG: protein kinase domain-containing protein [Myxococcaceae bacterium]